MSESIPTTSSLHSTSSLLEHRAQTINLAAGPSVLPTPVLLEATSGLLEYNHTGIGLTELSHRSSHFQTCLKDAERDLRELLAVPDTFDVLFMQGGGLTQFATVPLNLLAAHRVKTQQAQDPRVEYVVSGSWSLKAAGEAKRLGGCDVNIVVDGRTASPSSATAAKKAFGEDALPPGEGWAWSTPDDPKPAYIYYCSNETVNGVEIAPPTVPAHLADVPLVSDMSSNILSRPIPWDAHNWGLIYAGAQKNIGPAGLTIVLVRKDLVVDPDEAVPLGGARVPAMLSYKSHADAGSLYNTPPMFPIYVAGLVFKHLKELGGVDKIEELNTMKAAAVYRAVDESNGFYVPRVQEALRSRMNVVFAVPGEGRETRFIAEAEKAGIKQIKGHRSVGGIRTSLYNAVTLDQVQALVGFMRMFMQKEQEIEQHA